jgi:WD40 repeat protein
VAGARNNFKTFEAGLTLCPFDFVEPGLLHFLPGGAMSKTVLEGHGGQIWSVSFCRESKIVAAGSEDHTIHL